MLVIFVCRCRLGLADLVLSEELRFSSLDALEIVQLSYLRKHTILKAFFNEIVQHFA
jgi:hypothetical protein